MCGRRPLDCPVPPVLWAVPARCSSFLDSAIGHANAAPWYIYTLREPLSSTPSHMPVADLSDPLDLATILDIRQCYFVSQVPWVLRIRIQHAFTQYLFATVFVLRVHTDGRGRLHQRRDWSSLKRTQRASARYHSKDCIACYNPDRKSTRLNSSHSGESRMPSSA